MSSVRRERQPTVIDVAAEAGVAVGTVSRFLRGQPVRDGNREQIERAIDLLGYRHNALAASMKTGEQRMIGFLLPGLSEFHAGLLGEVSQRLRRSDRAVLSYLHDFDRGSILEGIDFFRSHRVNSIVLAGVEHVAEDLHRALRSGVDFVLYDNDVPGLPADRAFVEHRKASREAVEYLLRLGHRRIATIHGMERDSAGRERLGGYRDAMAAAGISPDPELIVDGGWNEVGGRAAIARLMALETPPTAVYSANYSMSFGALEWCRDNGVRLPDDLSWVSFDDVPAFCLHSPKITAVDQRRDNIAVAIDRLLEGQRLKPGPEHRQEVAVSCDLVIRDSVRAITP
ncbi:LacI family DNA-binding transcriptional regulator [Pelagovum pacificum]|uniref:LacI family transcriptional regulator n=1 Tax=Pelagovum pacificum TaxID=2588711 RepID=A0A5C5GCS5_9RHOB|nr:LacI family DNA-binding transcriptional regulator [Pelagovum pacificum]QQA44338.1 LacI family DNA-binding transcriptional regulator [Pelagovum pacificum]TNY32543.1 LacI family transcriptional regulator [Pelagovum pacificum]